MLVNTNNGQEIPLFLHKWLVLIPFSMYISHTARCLLSGNSKFSQEQSKTTYGWAQVSTQSVKTKLYFKKRFCQLQVPPYILIWALDWQRKSFGSIPVEGPIVDSNSWYWPEFVLTLVHDYCHSSLRHIWPITQHRVKRHKIIISISKLLGYTLHSKL